MLRVGCNFFLTSQLSHYQICCGYGGLSECGKIVHNQCVVCREEGTIVFPVLGIHSYEVDFDQVAESATPGKTKHFQTLHLPTSGIVLCDCPGLVFPSFVATKADMVCNGLLPIDQLRDVIEPTNLVSHMQYSFFRLDLFCSKVTARIPRAVLEYKYGIQLPRPSPNEPKDRPPSGHELLRAYGAIRGFMTSHGQPDEVITPVIALVILESIFIVFSLCSLVQGVLY